MPAPSPWKASDLTPAVIKASDGSIRTVTGQRDGSRPSGPAAPEFTTSTTSTSITATITDGKGADSYESRIGSGSWIAGLTVSGLSIETAYTFQVRGIDDIDAAQPINLWFTPAQMDSLELSRHWLDVQIILGDARVYTLMGGSAPVVHDVTRHTSTVPLATGIEILETFTYSSFTVEAA